MNEYAKKMTKCLDMVIWNEAIFLWFNFDSQIVSHKHIYIFLHIISLPENEAWARPNIILHANHMLRAKMDYVFFRTVFAIWFFFRDRLTRVRVYFDSEMRTRAEKKQTHKRRTDIL